MFKKRWDMQMSIFDMICGCVGAIVVGGAFGLGLSWLLTKLLGW